MKAGSNTGKIPVSKGIRSIRNASVANPIGSVGQYQQQQMAGLMETEYLMEEGHKILVPSTPSQWSEAMSEVSLKTNSSDLMDTGTAEDYIAQMAKETFQLVNNPMSGLNFTQKNDAHSLFKTTLVSPQELLQYQGFTQSSSPINYIGSGNPPSIGHLLSEGGAVQSLTSSMEDDTRLDRKAVEDVYDGEDLYATDRNTVEDVYDGEDLYATDRNTVEDVYDGEDLYVTDRCDEEVVLMDMDKTGKLKCQ
jgi:hypothetical protein